MSEGSKNPYQAPSAMPLDKLPSTARQAFWAGAFRAAKLPVALTYTAEFILFLGVLAFDPILRADVIDDFQKSNARELVLGTMLFSVVFLGMLPLVVAFKFGLMPGLLAARDWNRLKAKQLQAASENPVSD